MKQVVEQALSVLIVALGLTAVFDLPGRWLGLTIFPQQYLGAFWGLVSCLCFLTSPAGAAKVIRWYDRVLAGCPVAH